ncbi:MFS transporter [Ralstonia sp. 3N]|nr:MFS transporter [Ralstonia insidiosa]MBA9939277.1 MFS transporter [Ralstonia insidiosa]MBC9968052.1 MFS transporter [Ralstonia insidiosa]NPT52552.1 MFS transporter [Ralstonia sp. 3N]SCW55624.1 Major Facilitator Superfamily protein [Ralstonia sp. UNCCL144]
MFATVSLLNEISAQMVAPLIPILIATVLAAGPVALGVVEGIADAVAAFLKLWSGRHADLRPDKRKAMVLLGYGLALVARPLIGLAGHWGIVVALRSADRLGKGLREAPRDAILADVTPAAQRGAAYGLNRGMDYAGAVLGTLIAAAALAWWGIGIPQVILLSAVPGVAVFVMLALAPNPISHRQLAIQAVANAPLEWQRLSSSLRGFLKVLALFCFARASEAFIVLRGHELGMTTVTLLLIWAWLAALQTLTALIGAPLTDQISKRQLTLLNWASLVLGYAALAWASDSTSLWIAVSVYALLSGISEGIERSLVSELAGPGEKGTAFGWYYMISGLASIPAGILFGVVWKTAGAAAAFGMTSLIALLSAAWLQSVFRRTSKPT